MNPLPKKTESESDIQTKFVKRLTLGGWYCLRTHGNAYQAGFPDLYVAHKRYGTRWIEIKKIVGSRFTQSQIDVFTAFSSKDIGVWVITGYTEYEERKLFASANWHTFLKGGIDLNHNIPRIKKFGPEAVIQDGIIASLTQNCGCKAQPACREHATRNWFCLETYGSMFQSGFPDIYCCHKLFGGRWIECKNPKSYKFTPAQVDVFPRLAAEGVPIHVLVDSSDWELNKLFGPANWHTYMWK